MSGGLRLSARASKLAAKGRLWFYSDDLEGDRPGHGELVRVAAHDGRNLGLGFYSEASRMPLRLCGLRDDADGAPDPAAFFRARLERAIATRGELRGPRRGVRLVHAEADGVPGLVVDAYDRCLAVQATTATVERHLDCIVPPLVELAEAQSVIARHDVAVREREGLSREVRLLHGRRPAEVAIEEHGVVHAVDPWGGQKTGFYLDQRPARGRVKSLAAGRAVLDLFSYQGGFSLAALAGGARSALAVDQSAAALERAAQGAASNDLSGLEGRRANAFDVLRELRTAGEQFGLVVVDPPAFAKSRRELRGAERGYRDLNRSALRVLAAGGYLVTCSCSHHVSREGFEGLLRQAAAGLPFRVMLRERLMAGDDHPAWIGLPESEYLKVCVLQRVDP